MNSITFKFNQAKAVETVLYLVHRISAPDVYSICKLLYLSDKLSLENFGRFICNESYYAMEQGSTPSNTYDLLKRARRSPINGIKVEKNAVIALRPPDLDQLSESDIECLDKIIDKYEPAPYKKHDDAHDVAWQKNWDSRGNKKSKRIAIEDIAELFPDTEDLISYLSNSET